LTRAAWRFRLLNEKPIRAVIDQLFAFTIAMIDGVLKMLVNIAKGIANFCDK